MTCNILVNFSFCLNVGWFQSFWYCIKPLFFSLIFFTPPVRIYNSVDWGSFRSIMWESTLLMGIINLVPSQGWLSAKLLSTLCRVSTSPTWWRFSNNLGTLLTFTAFFGSILRILFWTRLVNCNCFCLHLNSLVCLDVFKSSIFIRTVKSSARLRVTLNFLF